VKVALAQINCTVGDLAGNLQAVLTGIDQARKAGAELVAFPELCIAGYPPVDLLLNRAFLDGVERSLSQVAAASREIAVVVGAVARHGAVEPDRRVCDASLRLYRQGGALTNAAFLFVGGRLAGTQAKTFLPNYDVFDETRYFVPARERALFQLGERRFGVNICEDLWVDGGPADEQCRLGAEFILNIAASPFYAGKAQRRRELVAARARSGGRPVLYANLVGGQDSLIFDGGSMACDRQGRLVALARQFVPDLVLLDVDCPVGVPDRIPGEVEETCQALQTGLRDYVNKNRFEKVVLGLSGGVDSALVAALARDALGPERVVAVSMPGPYTSKASRDDARKLAQNLYIELRTIPIDPVVRSYTGLLRGEFRGRPEDVTEQNIQARVRGNILMALSNKFGWLVLSTGNKSEVAVGYNTLYGDLAGGLSVISDVPKTMVYRLCNYLNDSVGREIIPRNILVRAPTAELRPNQTDQDDLPPYDVLDTVLRLYVEENRTAAEIVAAGHDPAVVSGIIRRVDASEYKRQQAPLGLKITPRAFGFGRRMPVTNRFRSEQPD
jgi:NAD+ synthase (glutamine-hydrolysing)